jgi:hypothetical protein
MEIPDLNEWSNRYLVYSIPRLSPGALVPMIDA